MRAPEQQDFDDFSDRRCFVPPPPEAQRGRIPPQPVYRYPTAHSSSTSSYYYQRSYGPENRHHAPTMVVSTDTKNMTRLNDGYYSVSRSDIAPPTSLSPPPQSRDSSETSLTPSTPTDENIPDKELQKFDVLSGRGGGTNNWSGNKFFRRLVENSRSEYVLSKKVEKRAIARGIVMTIRSKGGRFLKKEGSFWRDIGDSKAREKTSQALREGLAAKMRQAYAACDSGAAAHVSTTVAAAISPASSTHATYQPPIHYSPHSVSGNVHPRTEHRDAYYDHYEHPYEPYDYHTCAQSPMTYETASSSPMKRRKLTYEVDPGQTEAV
jgi:hypothetical protein